MSAPQPETLTFLFTDIEGSTYLWEHHPEAMYHAHARHVQLIGTAVQQQQGTLIRERGEGDSTFSVFENPDAALAAACAFQRALQSESWPPEVAIRVRAALHTGAAYPHFHDFNSAAVNRCARLRAIAHGEQTLLSHATYQQVQSSPPEGVRCKDLGIHRLKDLREPEHVYQLLHPALRADFPPLNSLDNHPHNLPRQLTSFVGREWEMAAVTQRLASAPLVTLLGTGGVGKTRLALQVAAEQMEAYPDGVWLVELASLRDPNLVALTVALTLGLREEAGHAVVETLQKYLSEKRALLLLDNCEHLIGACASLAADLLRACPNLTILATSREPLHIPGEQLWRLPSLTLPEREPGQAGEKDGTALLAACDSVRLFVERACLHRADFALTSHNASTVADICRRLDGIPLAIELAAARVRALSVEQIASRLEDRFALLTGGSRTALARQQTLSALIDWSYALLSEAERSLLGRLSVFSGGWTLEAAEAVCGEEGRAAWEILDLLTSLVDKSLVVFDEQDEKGRYHLLQTIKHYGQKRLESSGESESIQARHAAFSLKMAEEGDANLKGAEQAYWLNHLEREHDNLRAALAWGRETEERADFSLKIAGFLSRFWSVHGHNSEGRQVLSEALERTRGGDATPARAKALNGLGTLTYEQGDYTTARSFYEEALNIARAFGDQQGIQNTLGNLGNVAYYQGDYAGARALYEEVLAIRRELKDEWGIGNSLYNLGNLALQQNDFEAAYRLYEESLTVKRKLGDQQGIAHALLGLGTSTASLSGDLQAARGYMEESLSLFQEIGNKIGIAYTLQNLGELAKKQQDRAGAKVYLRQSLVVFQDLGDVLGAIFSLEGLAAALETDQARLAAQWMGAAEARREELSAPVPPAGREAYDSHVAALRDALGPETFAKAWEAGRKLTWDAILALAKTA